jgi:hypothetical protein
MIFKIIEMFKVAWKGESEEREKRRALELSLKKASNQGVF